MHSVRYITSRDQVDWAFLKACLAEDQFDNGRTAQGLEKSFRNSTHVVFALLGEEVVGTARALSDGVCNGYIIDVWTYKPFRNQGIARRMVQMLLDEMPGQHVYLQTDDTTVDFYKNIGFQAHAHGFATVVGDWLSTDK